MWGEEWNYPPLVPLALEPEGPVMLFVYGSLKKGYKHHNMLHGSTPFGEAETEPSYLLYDTGPYPGMIEVKENEGRSIEGELYLLPSEVFKKLDKNVPWHFKKKEVKLKDVKLIEVLSQKVITHIYDQRVDRFLDCGVSWPRY